MAAAHKEVHGRREPSHVFLKECYDREERSLLAWWLKMKKFRDADAARKGESQTLKVMRDIINGAVPRPSDAFERVHNMKPADYRMRKPKDYAEAVLNEAVQRLGLFKNPSTIEPMYPVPQRTSRKLFIGTSKEGGGSADYFKERYRWKPEVKYRFSPSIGQDMGFHLDELRNLTDVEKSGNVRRCVIQDTFYTKNFLPVLERLPSNHPIIVSVELGQSDSG